MSEPFANERKNIKFESGQLTMFGVLSLSFTKVWPTLAKSAKTAENHNKEGPINTYIGKSRAETKSIMQVSHCVDIVKSIF